MTTICAGDACIGTVCFVSELSGLELVDQMPDLALFQRTAIRLRKFVLRSCDQYCLCNMWAFTACEIHSGHSSDVANLSLQVKNMPQLVASQRLYIHSSITLAINIVKVTLQSVSMYKF